MVGGDLYKHVGGPTDCVEDDLLAGAFGHGLLSEDPDADLDEGAEAQGGEGTEGEHGAVHHTTEERGLVCVVGEDVGDAAILVLPGGGFGEVEAFDDLFGAGCHEGKGDEVGGSEAGEDDGQGLHTRYNARGGESLTGNWGYPTDSCPA